MSVHPLPPEGPSAVRVWLEVDLDTEPIRGLITTPGGVPTAFVGWLGLTSALDALRRGPDPGKGEVT